MMSLARKKRNMNVLFTLMAKSQHNPRSLMKNGSKSLNINPNFFTLNFVSSANLSQQLNEISEGGAIVQGVLI